VHKALKAAGHRVTMVAPLTNQSGMSARISYSGVLEVRHPVTADDSIIAVSGTPADAVAFALHTLPSDKYPDVVVSGTNYGQNTSRATNHSGTVGAATTAADRGVPAIAVSSSYPGDYGSDDSTPPDFEGTAQFVNKLLNTLQRSAPDCGHLLPPGLGLNVNYPFNGLKGVKSAELDTIDPYPTAYTRRPDGTYDISSLITSSSREDVDYALIKRGYATLTPLDGNLSASSGAKTGFISKLVNQVD
jgi:5'-nucleotidase